MRFRLSALNTGRLLLAGLSFVFPVAILSPAAGQQTAPAAAEVAQDPAATAAKIDKLFAPWDKKDAPGCMVTILRDGKTLYSHGVGLANLEYNVPNTASTVFCLASVSKQFTAFCIQLLADQGKLSLDDDIRKYVPEMHDFGKPITIRHLIHHTSGLRDYFALLNLAGWRFEDAMTEQDILRMAFRQKDLNFEPGAAYEYSNTGYVLLGLIVRRASGKSLREFADESVFQPLGMTNTHFHDDYTVPVKNRAISYYPEGTDYRQAILTWTGGGEGNLYSTAEDLAKWDENFYTARVGGPRVIAAMQEKGRLNNGKEISYASGLGIGEYRGLPTVQHDGLIAGFRTVLLRFPQQKFSVIILANLSGISSSSLAYKAADICLEGQFKPTPAPTPAKTASSNPKPAPVAIHADLYEKYAGDYEFESGLKRSFYVKAGKFYLKSEGIPDQELLAESDHAFFLQDYPARYAFEPNQKRGAKGIKVVRDDGSGAKETGSRAEPYDPETHQLAEYVGDYYSEELDTTFAISLTGRRLTCTGPKLDATLSVTRPDRFLLGGVQMLFERDAKKRITGFLLSAEGGRVQRLRFVRLARKPESSAPNPPAPYAPGDAALYETLTGRYGSAANSGVFFTISTEDGRLFARLTGQEPMEIYPLRNDAYFYSAVDAQITFTRKPTGEVSGLTLHQNGKEYVYYRSTLPALTLLVPGKDPDVRLTRRLRESLLAWVSDAPDPVLLTPELRDGLPKAEKPFHTRLLHEQKSFDFLLDEIPEPSKEAGPNAPVRIRVCRLVTPTETVFYRFFFNAGGKVVDLRSSED